MLHEERNHTWRTLGLLSVAMGAALVLSAWTWQTSGNAEPTARTAENTVEVSVAEDSLELSSTSLDTGAVSFEVTNEGDTPHSLAISGAVEERIQGEIAPSEMKSLEATLDAGTYTAYCPVEGHRETESVEFTVGK